ncbi:glycosyltransferase family 4 protein [Gammaproteobacteria bacterium]|nr:glycosyltransferase family 4 protein [Gammaproteobacteria bacterium]
MRILVLCYNFPPDISAGAFRMHSFVKELEKNVDDDSCIEIITTTPNRYLHYQPDSMNDFSSKKIKIKRVNVSKISKGFVGQVLGFLKYSLAVIFFTSIRKYDLVFSTSSKLMTGFLGALISRMKSAKLYLDIRDIFSETIEDVFDKKVSIFMLPIIDLIESYAVNRASVINLVSKGFEPYFVEKYPEKIYSFHTNGIDEEFIEFFSIKNINNRYTKIKSNESTIIRILYAGNIGEGQGLEKIIPDIAIKMNDKIHFQIIGDGSSKESLHEILFKRNIKNVWLEDPIPRDQLMDKYLEADILFMHLNDYDAFKRVLPSKVFEYASTGLPIWAGVSGYCKLFLDQHIQNVQTFTPCDADDAISKFESLKLDFRKRTDFIEIFSRKHISKRISEDFLKLGIEYNR